MGKKGGNRKTKALVAPKSVNIKRKEQVWTIHTVPGAHKRTASVALAIALRELLNIATTMKEVKAIINAGEVKVNGVVKKDARMGLGLFDTVDMEKQKLFYRVLLDKKGRLYLKNLEEKSNEKIVKVEHKKMVSKGVQLTTDDSRVYFNDSAKRGDSLKIKLPEGKIDKVLPLQKGSIVFITKGEHCSELATVEEIIEGTDKREKLVKLKNKNGEFETIPKSVYVIGEGKAELKDIE
ncbi:MAG TPA: hypothetical protein PKK60_02650 [archaeon]|nr:hypothetical protein [archaeon]